MVSEQFPSIFNDVIGPVMRGPSSSHSAAAVRIGAIGRDLACGEIAAVEVKFDQNDPLASSYLGHGSAMGLAGGFLGYGPDHPDLSDALNTIEDKGIPLRFTVANLVSRQTNMYRISITKADSTVVTFSALSTGGGMIQISDINGFPVSLSGDYYCSLFFFRSSESVSKEELYSWITSLDLKAERISESEMEGKVLFIIESREKLSDKLQNEITLRPSCYDDLHISPVLPVLSRREYHLPFSTAKDLLAAADKSETGLGEAGLRYETARSGRSQDEVFDMMGKITDIMSAAVENGLAGTQYQDRILPGQSPLITKNKDRLYPDTVVNSVIQYISAVMEVKSSMGLIVAAPTAGACGCLPGTIFAAGKKINAHRDKIIKALFAAGIIGVFIARDATFAGEIGACQVECGSASAMTAAAVVELMGGGIRTAVDAAALALQGLLGLACDPVADRVEVPCLNKNILAGTNALSCANMALAGYRNVIPFEETITAMKDVYGRMPAELRCTGLGGLALSNTAGEIYKKLNS